MTEGKGQTPIDRTAALFTAHRDDCPTCKAAELYADEQDYPQAGYCEAGREFYAARLAAGVALGVEVRKPAPPAPNDETPF